MDSQQHDHNDASGAHALAFYFAAGSCSLASLICLNEAGASYKERPVMLSRGEQRQPAYLAINPRGRVPALAVGSQIVTENIAIISYISARYPQARLLPVDQPAQLGRAYEIMCWYASTLHVWIAEAWRTERFTTDEAVWPTLKAFAQERLTEAFFEIDALCSGGPWVLGETFSAVDAYTLIFWRWGERLGVDMAQHRNWALHSDRMLARPSVIAALETEQRALAAADAL